MADKGRASELDKKYYFNERGVDSPLHNCPACEFVSGRNGGAGGAHDKDCTRCPLLRLWKPGGRKSPGVYEGFNQAFCVHEGSPFHPFTRDEGTPTHARKIARFCERRLKALDRAEIMAGRTK